jgi:molecular chaperone HscB
LVKRNFFDIFGLQISYRIDEPELTKIYLEKQRKIHSDAADAVSCCSGAQSPDSLVQTNAAKINAAYRTLMDPVARAEHLMEIRGISIDNTSTDFAEEMFDIRQRYALLSSDDDKHRFVSTLEDRMQEIVMLLNNLENDIDQFKSNLCLLRFINSFLEKVETDVYSRN